MERRASLVLMVLVQSTTQLPLGGEHYLRPERLKLNALYREPLSEFMDFDPYQNKFGGNGLFVVEFPSRIPGPVPLEENGSIFQEVEKITIENRDPNSLNAESLITEELVPRQQASARITSDSELRIKRDASFVDSDLHDFAPRRFRGSRMRL